MIRTVRRSSARDLPPAADDYTPVVSSTTPARAVPATGTMLTVRAPCDLTLRVRVESSEPTETGWIGWAAQVGGDLADFRARGVPVTDLGEKFRIFDWQVVNR